jgi:glycosyltransferase involved in cell wall biosynthesis
MATFNGARFLQLQLASIAAQQLPPTELLVSDDGSTDETLMILEAFATTAPFPVRIMNGPQRGAGCNFLTAAQNATGELIAFSDQDDVWLPSKLLRCANLMNRYNAMLVTHYYHVVDGDLHRRAQTWAQRALGLTQRLRVSEPFTESIWTPLAGNTSLVRRDIVELVRDPDSLPTSMWSPKRMHHDDCINLLAMFSGVTVRSPERLLLYRQHDSNVDGVASSYSENRRSSYSNHVRFRQAVAEEWANWFPPLLPPRQRALAKEYLDQAADRQARRAELIEAPSVTTFLHNLKSGDYRSNGLGHWALLRDSHYLAASHSR